MPKFNILNLVIPGAFTLLGAFIGFLGTWLVWWFQTKEQREGLVKALFEEIKLNHSVAKRFRERYKASEWTVFEAAPLYTLAYQNIRTSGELSILSRDALSLLEETCEMIYAHNRQVTTIASETGPTIGDTKLPFIRDRGLKERAGKIEANLKRLEEEFLKQLKFLKQSKRNL